MKTEKKNGSKYSISPQYNNGFAFEDNIWKFWNSDSDRNILHNTMKNCVF